MLKLTPAVLAALTPAEIAIASKMGGAVSRALMAEVEEVDASPEMAMLALIAVCGRLSARTTPEHEVARESWKRITSESVRELFERSFDKERRRMGL